MPLSTAEKQAGRAFRDARQAALDNLNAASPPARYVLSYWRVVRHECQVAGGASTGIVLREHYEASPEYRAGGKVTSPAGQFAFIWKQGKCPGCGLAARSRAGRFAVAADRPPDHGRTNGQRGPTSSHPGDPRLAGA